MPTPTYTPLATVTLGSAASSVTFSSIPATYRDLILVANPKATAAVNNLRLQFNGDTASNYTGVVMRGDGTTAASFNRGAAGGMELDLFGNGVETNLEQIYNVQIMDYSATDKHKTVLSRFNDASQSTGAFASRWASTSAVTQIVLYITGTTFAAGSNFSLYGVIA
jgi:hypothetical protein